MDAPFYPIIYVRGYAMTEGERDETTADPFCGFNAGSTVYRARVDRKEPAKKFIFESPMMRLSSDFEYRDVYENGADILDPDWQPRKGNAGIPARSVIIYRYYDTGSTLLGDGKSRDLEVYATGLSQLILRVKALVLAQEDNTLKPDDFKCYLVAHSMGGLVVRGFLQNKALGVAEARKAVDKVFTYATPHNGIDVRGLNVPSWLAANDINNFNRERMAGYLSLQPVLKKYGRVDYVHESAFPSKRMFCMVGSNRGDYEAAMGVARAFVGHGSDGLVKIENASVWGLNDKNEVTQPAATAYAYRSHSGHFGIVNSEEAYQNLTRFLFGDIRVDLWLEIDSVTLPPGLQGKDADIDALYKFDLQAGPRGKRWLLSRRVAEEDSSACRTHKQLSDPALKAARFVYLSTVFLANRARTNQADPTLAYSMGLNVRVPDYEVDRAFWPNQHYEGSALFNDTLMVSMEPPQTPGGVWAVKYGWQSQTSGQATQSIDYTQLKSGELKVRIPFASKGQPGMSGHVLLTASAWNAG